jgi:phospholipase/carboxylesterase
MNRAELDGPRVPPARGGQPRQLIVFLHGYGADGNDLIGLAPYFQRRLPDAAFVSPHAPEPIPGSPPGMGGGRQWFSLARYDPDMLRRMNAEGVHADQAADVYRHMFDGTEAARPALDRFLDAELKRLNLTAGGLALVGFSQGTMMALHVGLRRQPGPAAIIGFSGALIGADRLPAEARCRPRVLLVHGDADEVVPLPAMHAALNALAKAEVPARWHITPGGGHGIDAPGVELALDVLASAFAPDKGA